MTSDHTLHTPIYKKCLKESHYYIVLYFLPAGHCGVDVQGGPPGQAVQELRAGVRAESEAARLHPPPDRGPQVPGRPSAGPPGLLDARRGGRVFQSGDGTPQTGHWPDWFAKMCNILSLSLCVSVKANLKLYWCGQSGKSRFKYFRTICRFFWHLCLLHFHLQQTSSNSGSLFPISFKLISNNR